MEVALRRRLEGVAVVSISQSRQTAEVEFAPGDHVFSPAAFRAATAEAGVEVLTFQIDACGVIEQTGDSNWLIAGKNRFLLVERGTAPVGSAVCVSGRLHDRPSRPHRLRIVHVELVAGDARRAPE